MIRRAKANREYPAVDQVGNIGNPLVRRLVPIGEHDDSLIREGWTGGQIVARHPQPVADGGEPCGISGMVTDGGQRRGAADPGDLAAGHIDRTARRCVGVEPHHADAVVVFEQMNE